jgi:hypothetical protein
MTTTEPLTIAVIGTGTIGGTLGRAFAAAGHHVVFGSRHPGDTAVATGSTATVATIAEALPGADAVVLTVPGNTVADVVTEHAAALAGALVLDATNNIAGPGPAHSHAAVTTAVPTARYARAFNSLGVENMADPVYGDTVADMFYSAAETDRPVVEALITATGLRPVYVGENQHDLLDGVLRLWFALAIAQKHGRNIAFRLLER